MRPRPKHNAADLAGARRRDGARDSGRRRDSTANPFSVVITSGRKRGCWGSYTSLEAATAVAARLRQIGLPAVIEEAS
jgi:hypothetical protein